mmetsp:Transcript_29232/g.49344  ORF Transcript_29232/g.49344 Transcript_29232/m.49344 type:complete len:186 (+) Transcript_29232:73-630(+)
MRRPSSQKSIAEEEETELLEKDEQVKIVDSLKEEARAQNKFTRRGFGVVFMVVGFIFIFCLVHFQLEPWTMVHQSRFKSIIPPNFFIMFYLASIYVFFLGTAICKYGFARLNIIFTIVGFIVSLISLAFWLHVFYVYEIDIFHLFWLPFGNIACLLLAMYVDNDMNSLLKDADLLETFQYDVKSV